MSPKRANGFHTNTPPSARAADAKRLKALEQLSRLYRCVYCKRTIRDAQGMLIHETTCDARYVMTRLWRLLITRAEQRERREAV